jgi:hypothetical protein
MLTMEHPHIVLLPWAYRDLWGFIYPLFDAAITHFDLWVNDGEVPPQAPPPRERPEWTFRVTITDPEIVLVTDAQQAQCEALVLKVCLVVVCCVCV